MVQILKLTFCKMANVSEKAFLLISKKEGSMVQLEKKFI